MLRKYNHLIIRGSTESDYIFWILLFKPKDFLDPLNMRNSPCYNLKIAFNPINYNVGLRWVALTSKKLLEKKSRSLPFCSDADFSIPGFQDSLIQKYLHSTCA
jgi:hypothetical protein